MKLIKRAIPAFLIAVTIFSVVFVPTAYAASIVVNTNLDNTTSNDGLCTLREAINNANDDKDTTSGDCVAGAPGNDTITFAGNYTITLTSALPAITDSLAIIGKGTDNTIIQASTCNPVTLPGGCTPADWRVFTFTGGTANLEYMTVRFGNCDGSCLDSGSIGGNIYTSTELTLKSVNVESGYAGSLSGGGGGIFNHNDTLTIKGGSIIGGENSGNVANYDGGGIYNNVGKTKVINSTVSYNEAEGGGGIYIYAGQLEVMHNSFIDKNEAAGRGGGGILFDGDSGSDLTAISYSTISENHSTGDYGGGIYASDDGNVNATLTIEYSTIIGNVCENYEGGGVVTYGPTMVITDSAIINNTSLDDGDAGVGAWAPTTITNTTISGNNAPNATDYDDGAAGLGVYAANVTLYNVTITNNSGGYSGGISDWAYGGSTINIYNSIIYGNFGTDAPDCYNDTSVMSFQNEPSILGNDTHCTKSNDGSVISTNPGLITLADNGGASKTHAIANTSSSAYNASGGSGTSADQRQVPAVGTRDLGAFEYTGNDSALKVISSDPADNSTSSDITQLTVTFNKDVVSDGGPAAANNANNYLLVERGVNTFFDTQACAEGRIADDDQIIINSASYNSGTNTATLNVNGGTFLPDGVYRLFVCGTTSIYDLVGMQLNGNVKDTLIDFTINQPTFPDVPGTHWAVNYVEAIYNAGLTSGYPDGTYRPENPVSRAEMAVFLLNGMGVTVPAMDGSHPFTDIAGHWAEKYIEELFDQGITGGYPDGTYRPENLVTRAEMAVFLLKGIGVIPPAMDGSHPFTDIDLHWAEIFIEELFDQGITGGYPDGTYRPEIRVTRAEMAVFLVNTFNIPLP